MSHIVGNLLSGMGSSKAKPTKILFKNVEKVYSRGSAASETVAINNLNIDIKQAEVIAILGPTGCGKSSALNLIAGFEQPTSGSVLLDNQYVVSPSPERAVVFQQPTLFPWLTAFDNVVLGVKCRGVPRDVYEPRAQRLLDEVGLADFADHYPYQLSGGMQQRVQIARALISEPQVLLMDEPFGALDAQTRLVMQELLLNLWAEYQPTIFFITHDVAEAIFIADRVLVMTSRPGRIKVDLAVEENKPRTTSFLSTPVFSRLHAELLSSVREEIFKTNEQSRTLTQAA